MSDTSTQTICLNSTPDEAPSVSFSPARQAMLAELAAAIRRLGLSQEACGRRIGLSQSKISFVLRGRDAAISDKKLIAGLMALGYDVSISIRPTRKSAGQLKLNIQGR